MHIRSQQGQFEKKRGFHGYFGHYRIQVTLFEEFESSYTIEEDFVVP
jgi:hypothetical protein